MQRTQISLECEHCDLLVSDAQRRGERRGVLIAKRLEFTP